MAQLEFPAAPSVDDTFEDLQGKLWICVSDSPVIWARLIDV